MKQSQLWVTAGDPLTRTSSNSLLPRNEDDQMPTPAPLLLRVRDWSCRVRPWTIKCLLSFVGFKKLYINVVVSGFSCSMWDLQLWCVGSSSWSRDWIWTPCMESSKSQPLDHKEAPCGVFKREHLRKELEVMWDTFICLYIYIYIFFLIIQSSLKTFYKLSQN